MATCSLWKGGEDTGTSLSTSTSTSSTSSTSDTLADEFTTFAPIAAEVAGLTGTPLDDQGRSSAYDQLTQLADGVAAAKQSNPQTAAQNDAKLLGATLYVMLDQLRADMASQDSTLASAASQRL